jgi:hypothetical protein
MSACYVAKGGSSAGKPVNPPALRFETRGDMRDFFLPIKWWHPHHSLLLNMVIGRPNGVFLGWWRRIPLPIGLIALDMRDMHIYADTCSETAVT